MRYLIIILIFFSFSFFPIQANEDSLYVVLDDDSVTIWHINAYRHCAAEYQMNTQINDNIIVITEKDIAPGLADCYCYFNLSVTFYQLEAGDYLAIVKSDTANEVQFIDSVYFSTPLITTPLDIFSSEYQSECFDQPTLIHHTKENLPQTFDLLSAYPNPFNPCTNIAFNLLKNSYVELNIYDISGRKMETMLTGDLKPGLYKKTWDASRFSSGIYIISLRSDHEIQSVKLLFIK
jgi:hypothetical protein